MRHGYSRQFLAWYFSCQNERELINSWNEEASRRRTHAKWIREQWTKNPEYRMQRKLLRKQHYWRKRISAMPGIAYEFMERNA